MSLDILDGEAREGRGRFPLKTRFFEQCKHLHIPSFPPCQYCVLSPVYLKVSALLFLFQVLIAGLANRAVRLPAGLPIAQWPEAVPRGPFGEASRVVAVFRLPRSVPGVHVIPANKPIAMSDDGWLEVLGVLPWKCWKCYLQAAELQV